MTPSTNRCLRNAVLMVALLGGGWPAFGQATTPRDTVARLDSGLVLTFGQVSYAMGDWHYDLLYRNNLAAGLQRTLDELMVQRLKVNDFFRRGLYRNLEFSPELRRTIAEELVILYFRNTYLSRFVNDSTIADAYQKLGREVGYVEVRLAKPKSPSERQRDSVAALASRRAGEVRKNTASDALLPDNAMRWVGWEQSLTDATGRQVFALAPGETAVVETEGAFVVVKAVRVRSVPVAPLERVRTKLSGILENRSIDRAYAEFEKEKAGMVDEAKAQWNDSLVARIAAWAIVPGFVGGGYRDTIKSVLEHAGNERILGWPEGQVDLRELLRLMENVLVLPASSTMPVDEVKKYVLEAVRTDIMAKRARAQNLEETIFNPRTANAVVEAAVVRAYDAFMIERNIPPATEEALHDFYKENRDSLFYQLAKVNVYALLDTSKAGIEALQRQLAQGVPFLKLRPETLVKTFIRKRDGSVVSHFSPEPPYLGPAAINLKPGEVAGPISYVDTTGQRYYALIQGLATREEKQLTYEDVATTIADKFREYHRNRLAEENRRMLMSTYPVVVDQDAWRQNLRAKGFVAP